MKKIITSCIVIVATAIIPNLASAESLYINDGELTIDNMVEEAWGEALIDDGEDEPDRTRQCWVSDSTWTDITNPDDCVTYIYDELGQIDVTSAWARMNETNLYFAYGSAATNYSIWDQTNQQAISLYDSVALDAIGMTGLPQPFDHKFVFAFDVDPNDDAESYDWYIVANVTYDFDTGVGPGDNEAFMQIWQESGANDGFQFDEDTLVENFALEDFETASITDPSQVDPIFEIRFNIEQFYEVTGITVGDVVGFRLETHSDSADVTSQEVITFVDAPTPKAARKLSVSQTDGVILKWKKPTNTTPEYYRVELRKFGVKNSKKWTVYKHVTKTKKTVSKQLTVDERYQFRVKACNVSGCSRFSDWKAFTAL